MPHIHETLVIPVKHEIPEMDVVPETHETLVIHGSHGSHATQETLVIQGTLEILEILGSRLPHILRTIPWRITLIH